MSTPLAASSKTTCFDRRRLRLLVGFGLLTLAFGCGDAAEAAHDTDSGMLDGAAPQPDGAIHADSGDADGATDAGDSEPGKLSNAWLKAVGNKLVTQDGKPFHGRGANLHDMRSCNACTSKPPNPVGLMAWSDELIDRWHANFVRFALESYSGDDGYRNAGQWKTVVDDAAYLKDIKRVVSHMTAKPGVYVMVSLWIDATMKQDGQDPQSEWPTDATLPIYKALAEAFRDDPQVLFALTNEPHDDASSNPDLAIVFQKSIEAIRSVERTHGTPPHIIVAQAAQGYARDLSYWVDHPLGDNIAYETHPYNPQSDFDKLFVQPAKKIPVIIGEFGPVQGYQSLDDAKALMAIAEQNDISYLAWNFHQRCDPNLLLDMGGSGYDGCGFDGAGTSYTWPPTEFGMALKEQLATPW